MKYTYLEVQKKNLLMNLIWMWEKEELIGLWSE